MTDSVTYDPSDDKLRVYFLSRQGADILGPLKALGFRWAGAQECWWAHWGPAREDAALAATGAECIDDEGSSLEDRAAARADRFADYQGNAVAERDRLWRRDQALAAAMNGQPVLVGHHSEKRHRRDLARMDAAMRGACKAARRADYWAGRASGSVQWAARKESPGVRARRIKTLEAEARKVDREIERAQQLIEISARPWAEMLAVADGTLRFSWEHGRRLREAPEAEREAVAREVGDAIRADSERRLDLLDRWADHLAGRLTYERAQLAQQGAEHLLAPKPRRALLPLLNVRLPGCIEMTAEQYAALRPWARYIDKGPGYRYRRGADPAARGGAMLHVQPVFLTDKREDTLPEA